MKLINFIENVVATCSRIITFGASIQAEVRNKLIDDLQSICSNVEGAYSSVLARLRPVKDAFEEPEELAKQLRDFAADTNIRDSFKPYKLCGNIDNLISAIENNLDPLKYSVDVRKIKTLRDEFQMIGDVDGAIYDTYDEFARGLDDVATAIANLLAMNSKKRLKERADYARHLITDFEDELFDAIKQMRSAKDRILR